MKAINFSGVSIIYFSRWTRKSYAVFSSLGRVVNISHLYTTLSLLLLTSVVAEAQSVGDSLYTDLQTLEEIEIGALEEPLAFSQLGRIITTITHDEIVATPVHDLASLLSVVQGVDIRQRGSNGMQADLRMRGGTFDQVLVLLNGIPISDPQTGHFNLNVPINLDNIDRVEVLQGPGASVFGANAYSGAINIISKAKEGKQFLLNTNGGSHGSYAYGASLNLSQKAFRSMVSYRQDGSNGYMANTDFLGKNLFTNTVWKAGKINIEATLAWQQKAFGANSFYSPKYPMQYETNEARIMALGIHWHGKIRTSVVPYYRQHRDNWQLLRDSPNLYQNFHQTDVLGLRTKSYFYTSWGKTTIGVDAKQEKLLSSSMGDVLDKRQSIAWASGQYFQYAYKRKHLSLFAQQSRSITQHWNMALSLMLHHYKAGVTSVHWYPGLHTTCQLSQRWKLIASCSNAMRLPTFTDLFYADYTNRGNKDLKAERSWTYELGVTYDNYKSIQCEVVAFCRQGRAIIDWVWRNEDSLRYAQNIGALDTYGVEASLRVQPNMTWNCKMWEFLAVNYTYLTESNMPKTYQGKYAANYLRHQINLQSRVLFCKHLYIQLNARYQSRLGNYLTYNFKQKNYGSLPYSDIFVLDAKVTWQAQYWQAFLQCRNLTDQKVVEYGVPQAGVCLDVGVKFFVGWK